MADQEKLLEIFYHMLKKMKKEWNNQLKVINHSQYLILRSLEQSGPQKAVQLAELTHITPGGITCISDKLVADGYAERKGDKEDRRVVYLEITDKGAELVRGMLEKQNEVVMKLFQGLPEEEIQHLIRTYNKIAENLQQ